MEEPCSTLEELVEALLKVGSNEMRALRLISDDREAIGHGMLGSNIRGIVETLRRLSGEDERFKAILVGKRQELLNDLEEDVV